VKNGSWCLVALALLLSGCRESSPPAIPIGTLDGFGGGDWVLEDGTRKYKSPSEMTNNWVTTQQGMVLFASWCYDIPPEEAEKALKLMQEQRQSVAHERR
jgi:hypothetical protein